MKGPLPVSEYVDALLRELDVDKVTADGRPIMSVFMGGGTPSLFDPVQIERFITGVHQCLVTDTDLEVTLEANPGTVDVGRLSGFREAGVNRLSIGVQSFNEQALSSLGRIHGRQQAVDAIEMAYRAGFDNINLDLMYGLPHQSVEDAIRDLEQAISLQPVHLSWYQLTIEPNTWFYHQPPKLPNDEWVVAMEQEGRDLLDRFGYQWYEVSAYAREQKYCRHNINYWQFGDYLGIGAGAHAKITNTDTGIIERTFNIKHPDTYLKCTTTRDRIMGRRSLSNEDIVFEFMLNALRLTRGFSVRLFTERTGLPIDAVAGVLGVAAGQGLISWDAQTISPTAKGKRFLDDLVGLFVPEARTA